MSAAVSGLSKGGPSDSELKTDKSLSKSLDVRLLEILPGLPSDKICVQLHHVTLDERNPPPYEALSYTWGSPENPVSIEVASLSTHDTYELHVTQNLATAIIHLRHHDRSRTIWADAICINQDDILERSHQVAMMGLIYRLARRVVAFIGPEEIDSTYLLGRLDEISQNIDVDFSSGAVTVKGSGEPHWANLRQEVPLGDRAFLAMYHLIHRPWFERLWIRQEIGLGGSNGVLLFGHSEIAWPAFCIAIFVLARKPLPRLDIFGPSELRAFRDRLQRVDTVALYSKRWFRLSSLRQQIGYSECQDPRDKIYGVLSQLKDPDTKLNIVPDYRRDAAEVYTDVVSRHITYNGNLAILAQCELRESNTLSLPSWVPDFSTTLSVSHLHFTSPPIFELFPAFSSIEGRVLQALGVHCGTITHITTIDEDVLFSGDVGTIQEIQRLLPLMKDTTDTYRTGEMILGAYCSTLCADNFKDRWHLKVDHLYSYLESVDLLESILKATEDEAKEIAEKQHQFFNQVRDGCKGRSIFWTDQGHMGLAPSTARIGDRITLLFGFTKPIVTRCANATPGKPLSCQVVGMCYAHGMMQGQPILGELPPYIGDVNDSNSRLGLYRKGYIDRRNPNDTIREEDPRMASFLSALVEKGLLEVPTLEDLQKKGVLDVLKEAGIPIQTFNLI
ncbi:heterokaryon incompatibility protein-domain-containing protein [Hypoxylon crocopeplum]|nr:heterokaryon incompatibility protein-domain-containing protein [Hypoxylon crocopeplum]